MPRQTRQTKRSVETYQHANKKRINNPLVGLVTPQTDPDKGEKQTYAYDPHIDPQLQFDAQAARNGFQDIIQQGLSADNLQDAKAALKQLDKSQDAYLNWAGKAERMAFEVPTQSLHVHERIDPRTIIEAAHKRNGGEQAQASLFAQERATPLRNAIEFYQHAHDWSNRLIAGDSLLVMNSLLEKENMAGKVQCVYMDPPYGIKYGSNFQPFVNKRDVQDGKDEDLTAEPEMIKAFRDTWELGIHSYLSYMRDRLLLAKELLADSGSVFVQIGDENVHRIGLLMDNVFGAENRIATISFATSSGSSAKRLPEISDYLLWYGKDKDQTKYHQLYEPLTRAEMIEYFSSYVMVELPDGDCRKITDEERFDPDKYLPKEARIYQRTGLDSQGVSTTGRSEPYEWSGKTFRCGHNRQWSISHQGLDHLSKLGRLEAVTGQNSLRWKKYEDEVPGRRINNIWSAQMYPSDKRYVVETSVKAIQRCILMATDPGDLVFDLTCGSGTTAYVAEQWGRRWITCDTSRVATTLAKQRLMTATFDYYKLAYPEEGVGSGFQYQPVAYVSPSVLTGDAPAKKIYLFDQPLEDSKRARVTGPFTVEAVPSPTVRPLDDVQTETPPADASVARSGATLRHNEWCDELLHTGIRGKGGQTLSFSRVELLPGQWLHAEAETKPDAAGADQIADCDTAFSARRVAISFGPEHAVLEQKQVELALQEAQTWIPKPEIVVFAAFQFDPEAARDIDETQWHGVMLFKVQMNADMQTADLKKNRAGNQSFWLMGQPEVELKRLDTDPHAGKYAVSVHGFDYFNTKTGELESGDTSNIAVWMLDTDYDGRSLYPSQVFFPMADSTGGWAKLAKSLRAEIDEELIAAYRGVVSLPFEIGENRRIAVKIVDDRGIESLKVVGVG